jgi:segregation and condensation protein B
MSDIVDHTAVDAVVNSSIAINEAIESEELSLQADMNVNPSILEAALFASAEPLTVDKLQLLFAEAERPSVAEIKLALHKLTLLYQDRGIELVEVASGYRFQVGDAWSPWLSRLWEKRPMRYSRALMETLALVAYRQPITRAEIEDVRGVVVSSNIIRTLLDRNWIKVTGTKDVPGKPSLFGTTKNFLDDINMTALSDLPELAPPSNIESVEETLAEQLHLHLDTNKALDQAIASAPDTINMEPVSNSFVDDDISSALLAADELLQKVINSDNMPGAEGGTSNVESEDKIEQADNIEV